MKQVLIILYSAFLWVTINAQNDNYPKKIVYEKNPFILEHSATDPDVHVWNGIVWVYCSQDHQKRPHDGNNNYAVMDGYHVFSSEDLINWIDHGEILHSRDVPWGGEGYMWAPGAAYKNGKYYIYYPHWTKDTHWRIGVAFSDSPTGPFKHIAKPIEGLSGIDPMVFIDDDGEAYIYCNPGVVAKLKPNMIELAEPARKIIYGSDEVMKNEIYRFCEGAYMHKKDGKYYFSYSNWKNMDYQGFYAIGDSPYGPFEWKGPMASKPYNAQDHHSIIEFKGKNYYFYHIQGPEYRPVGWVGERRMVCYDELQYMPEGLIKIVKYSR